MADRNSTEPKNPVVDTTAATTGSNRSKQDLTAESVNMQRKVPPVSKTIGRSDPNKAEKHASIMAWLDKVPNVSEDIAARSERRQ